MGSLVSPIVPLCRYWFRFMDDTCVIQQQAHKQAFLDPINSIDPAIKFTVEGNQGNGATPFFDTLVTPKADNSPSITVCHKPSHTDQYVGLIVTIIYLLNIVSLIHSPIGPKQFAPDQSSSRRSHNTLGQLWPGVNMLTGPSIGHKVNISTAPRRTTPITTTTKKTTIHKTSTTPAQAQTKPPTSWIAPTLHNTPTIQAQAQKKPLLQGKNPALDMWLSPKPNE